VELTYISSNEELFAKLKAGATGFDIIQPSDYITRRLIALSMLAPLDSLLLSNLHHLDPLLLEFILLSGTQVFRPIYFWNYWIGINVAKVPRP
jgi:spermidine/putrescine transport system substrate-binding protein